MDNNIYEIRGMRVMLDEDLANVYGVETKVLNQAVKRNLGRFPEEFVFQLTAEDFDILKSQIVTSRSGDRINKPKLLRSQIVTSKKTASLCTFPALRSQTVISKRGGRMYKPFAFTEHGAVMLASVLRSERAVKMSIEVVKAFVNMRHAMTSQENTSKQISEIKSFMLKQSNKNDREFRKVWRAIEDMTMPSNNEQDKQIGFRAEE